MQHFLDGLDEKEIECHSLMIVRQGSVIAEGWWAPYSADHPHLLYSLTKSFTSTAVGIAVDDGALSLDDRLIDVLSEYRSVKLNEQARRLTVRHLLTMTTGHHEDTLEQAWASSPDDLVRGFLGMPFAVVEGSRHMYDNATTFVLARMVERVTGRSLPDFLDEKLFAPMGIRHAEWDRVKTGKAFGFHGLHLTTEAIAAFGELMRVGGVWRGQRLISPEWIAAATAHQVESRHYSPGATGEDFEAGYGYQFWMSRHGFHGNGAFGQQCIVVPSAELVVVLTAAHGEVRHAQDVLDLAWDRLLPGIDAADGSGDDLRLRKTLATLAIPAVSGAVSDDRGRAVLVDDAGGTSALPAGTQVTVEPGSEGWRVHLGSSCLLTIGNGAWRESMPLGRPVAASGAWCNGTFVAHIRLTATPHALQLTVEDEVARLVWLTVPLTSPDLMRHLRSPLTTRPDVG